MLMPAFPTSGKHRKPADNGPNMTRREKFIARSIVYTMLNAGEDGRPYRRLSFWARLLRLFHLFWLTFRLVRYDLFTSLRTLWKVKEEDYKSSFRRGPLAPMGDMGYSGSTFFCTSDSAYLVKSVPRRAEHDFFKSELLLPYVDHMRSNPASLLVRITDFLESAHKSIGQMLGLTPSHHIVMENVLYGQQAQQQSDDDGNDHVGGSGRHPRGTKWESWDLKPPSYFYPERDIAGGALTSEATKSKLADTFEGKIRLSEAQFTAFKAQLETDTQLLASNNAVDYSLFLVRLTATPEGEAQAPPEPGSQPALQPGRASGEPIPPAQPPFSPPGPPTWRTGITSSDGKEVYRAVILDFFWAKHTVHAMAMTGLVNTYRVVDDAGPMSITTGSEEYRERFLDMCLGIVEVEG
ncbi:hypothetical protein SLS62_002668 [Diatrype stigma]|uniref:PIPK domain-containing protein n=1 Tax=Diatrype stigma TaxID=117547 RepID=A0AAN9V008_9PEZI